VPRPFAPANVAGAKLKRSVGGLHILAQFPEGGEDVELARRALAAGLKPAPLSGQYLGQNVQQGLLMSFTNVPESDAQGVTSTLANTLFPLDFL